MIFNTTKHFHKLLILSIFILQNNRQFFRNLLVLIKYKFSILNF